MITTPRPMPKLAVASAPVARPNRILLALAAAWMIAAIALGGVVNADPRSDAGPVDAVTGTIDR